MKSFSFILVLTLCVLASCGKKHEGPTMHDEAQKAAESYYACLIEGNYDQYVRGIHDVDSMDSSYYHQMVDVMAQYMSDEKAMHGGITKAKAVGDTIENDVAQVRLELTFGDNSQEQIVLPLVNVKGIWRLQ